MAICKVKTPLCPLCTAVDVFLVVFPVYYGVHGNCSCLGSFCQDDLVQKLPRHPTSGLVITEPLEGRQHIGLQCRCRLVAYPPGAALKLHLHILKQVISFLRTFVWDSPDFIWNDSGLLVIIGVERSGKGSFHTVLGKVGFVTQIYYSAFIVLS
jgi:hypothetical protein